MTDERVDALLKELEEALSLEPSPSVAAKVRVQIAAEAGRRSHAGPRLAAAAAIAAVAALTYGWWGPHSPASDNRARQAINLRPPTPAPRRGAPASPAISGVTKPAGAPHPVSGRSAPESRMAELPDAREPDVIVSPQVKLAVQYLQAAARAGHPPSPVRFSLESIVEPAEVTPAVVELLPLEALMPLPSAADDIGPRGPGGTEGSPEPGQPIGPPSRTRRTS